MFEGTEQKRFLSTLHFQQSGICYIMTHEDDSNHGAVKSKLRILDYAHVLFKIGL